MKILVFCSDLLPLPGLPTSGGGLRCWQMIQSLRAAGHEVVASMPLFTFHGQRWRDRVSESDAAEAWSPGDQDRLVDRHRPDAILFTSTWIVDQLQRPFEGLRIYDLDGPQLLEMHYKRDLDRAQSPHAKVAKLAQADFVFCAGHRQRYFFWPFLLLAGHDVQSLCQVPVIPIAHMEPPPAHHTPQRLEIVVAGGFYPWQDPTPGLRALGNVLDRQPPELLRVRIIGSSHGVTGDDDRLYQELRSELGSRSNVEFLDFMPHSELTTLCQNASFAFELHGQNAERELAVTTRTIDAMWCGLPVLYNNYGELTDLIRDYDAGWTIDPEDTAAIEQALQEIIADPVRIESKSNNAQRLIREHFYGPEVAAPLIEFLNNPVKRDADPPVSIVPESAARRMQKVERELELVQQSRAFKMARRVASIRQVWRSNRHGR